MGLSYRSSSSSSSAPISEHSRLHKLTPLWTILRTHLRCAETKVMRPKVELYRTELCPPWSTCPASPIRWRTIDGCSKNGLVVGRLSQVSEQTKSYLCDNWGDWGLTTSYASLLRWWYAPYMEYVLYTLVKCIEMSNGGHSHTPRVSSVKKYWEYVHIVKSNLGLQTDGRSSDVTV